MSAQGGQAEELTAAQRARYSRQLILPEVGPAGQAALGRAKVVVAGAGGLGSSCAIYLAAAGVGAIGLVDSDTVELTNLQRQILHTTEAIGQAKVESAERRLKALNPEIEIRKRAERLTSANAVEILAPYDVVVDATDNFSSRYLINDACVALRKPWVYGAVGRFEGQCATFAAGGGPCYRCLYPDPPAPQEVPSSAESGVLGALPGVIGCIQATECLKLILGQGQPLIGRLLLYDALAMRFRELRLQRDPRCPACGDRPRLKERMG